MYQFRDTCAGAGDTGGQEEALARCGQLMQSSHQSCSQLYQCSSPGHYEKSLTGMNIFQNGIQLGMNSFRSHNSFQIRMNSFHIGMNSFYIGMNSFHIKHNYPFFLFPFYDSCHLEIEYYA